jgi:hypothetical protein
LSYAHYVGLTGSEVDDFIIIMRLTDNEMLKYQNSKENTK